MLNSLIGQLIELRASELDALIQNIVLALIFIAYVIPLIFIVGDIFRRYSGYFERFILTILAIISLPIFVFVYFLFRRTSTIAEDREMQKHFQLEMISKKIIECPKCKEACPSDHKYCNSCGFFLRQICQGCTEIINLDWKFCVNCGHINKAKSPAEYTKEAKADKLLNALGYKVNNIISK